MPPQRISDRILSAGTEENSYCCEASSAGFRPGEWPFRVIMFGHTMIRETLSVIGGFYKSQTDSSCTLMIYND